VFRTLPIGTARDRVWDPFVGCTHSFGHATLAGRRRIRQPTRDPTMTDYGIDVSHFNSVDDWNAVRANNISFSFTKVSEGADYVDSAAGGLVDGARKAGIHVGGYHFARPGAPVDQARFFVDTARPHGLFAAGSAAPALDVEDTGVGDAFVSGWINEVRSATGIKRVVVYANLDFWTNRLTPSQWADGDVILWIARYNGDPGNPGWANPRLGLHQHSDKGTVPGIPGAVDRDATVAPFTLADILL
jgi:GH25 family lysozyme M1 (1,4-beta-N-acetylmuramidase)